MPPPANLTEKILRCFDPESKVRPSQTGKKRVTLTQMIRQRPANLINKAKGNQSPDPLKNGQKVISDFMFSVTSRENPFMNLYQDRKTPAIGHYNPKYDLLV
jgi:hypothetical protein